MGNLIAVPEIPFPEPFEESTTKGNIMELDENTKLWSKAGDDAYFPSSGVVHRLPPGQYTVERSMRGIYFCEKPVEMDEFVLLPDGATENILTSMEYFWTRKEVFAQFGFLWKRGILMWGPPGSGKTATVQRVSQQVIDRGGIAIYCDDPDYTARGLETLRKIEPDRPIVVMIEDIDSVIDNHGDHGLLSMLDGELQVDNVVYVATTNYPEHLEARFSQRPSRFDEVVLVGFPDEECRAEFFRKKNPRLAENEVELQRWVKASDEFSVAALKEMIIAIECLGQDLETVSKRLKNMLTGKPISSEQYK